MTVESVFFALVRQLGVDVHLAYSVCLFACLFDCLFVCLFVDSPRPENGPFKEAPTPPGCQMRLKLKPDRKRPGYTSEEAVRPWASFHLRFRSAFVYCCPGV